MSQDSKPGFEKPCPCGSKQYALERESICTACGRVLVVDWPTPPAENKRPS